MCGRSLSISIPDSVAAASQRSTGIFRGILDGHVMKELLHNGRYILGLMNPNIAHAI
jgi:hypothetical protein